MIPEQIRERLRLTPGQKLQALLYEGRIELLPLRSMMEMRGFLPGIDTDIEREIGR